MKILLNSLLVLSCFLCGCEQKPHLFDEDNGLYFGTADSVLSYSFAKYPKKTSDTLFIPVYVLGNTVAVDRSFGVEVIPVATKAVAQEGVHFKITDEAHIVANSTVGILPVIVYRTPEMDKGESVSFSIRLKKNELFPVDGIAVRQKLHINLAYMQKPASWGEFTGTITGYFAGYRDYFGTWSSTKYKLILEALYDPETETSVTEFPGSRFSPPVLYHQYVALVRNYIKTNYPGNYGLPGGKLLDPDNDNKPVQVGPANY